MFEFSGGLLGPTNVAANSVTLAAWDLPQNAWGYFLVSQAPGFIVNPGGSQGHPCVIGAIGRFIGPGQVMNSGSTGTHAVPIDLTSIPQPTMSVAVLPGDTRYFQGWLRDAQPPGFARIKFTHAARVTFD